MKVYNSIDVIVGLAVALEDRDIMVLTAISEQVAGWMIPDDEKAAYDRLISAILEELL
jgi:hypothetical protein